MQRLYSKIKLEIVDADMVIENADIAIEIKKTSDGKPHYCTITIYNISQNTYNILNDKANEVRVYVDVDDNGYMLAFEGILRDIVKWKKAKAKTKKKSKAKANTVIHYNEPPISRSSDAGNIITKIELQDGFKTAYIKNYYSKSYQGQVTNTQILNDIIDYMKAQTTIGIGSIMTLNEKTFPNGRVVNGTLANVLKQICATGDRVSVIDNNILNIFDMTAESDVYGYYLHGGICPRPEFNADKEISVEAPYLPAIQVGTFVKLEFEDLEGTYPVKSLESSIDNFGQSYETKLTLQAGN